MAGHKIPIEKRFWTKVEKSEYCWNWRANKSPAGYGKIKRDGKPTSASRVAWELCYGFPPGNKWVLHKCDNPSCVNPEHLFLGTPKENTKDMWDKGRHKPLTYPSHRKIPRGESATWAKLANDDIYEIRRLYQEGNLSIRAIGRQYGVTHEAIRKILQGKIWGHI